MLPTPRPIGSYKFLTNFPIREIEKYRGIAKLTNDQLIKHAISVSVLPQDKTEGTDQGSVWFNCTNDELQSFHRNYNSFSIFY